MRERLDPLEEAIADAIRRAAARRCHQPAGKADERRTMPSVERHTPEQGEAA